jgi:microcystin degradation protein MlrC
MASLATETNTFSPLPTGWAAFQECGLRKDASRTADSFGSAALGVWRPLADAAGWAVIEGLTAFAQPGGPTLRSVYERLRDDILEDLRAAGPVDMILLLLHGAMVAEGCDDCEGDILARVREIAPGAVLGLEIDPHCHLTEAMVATADVVVILKEYPHTDVGERAAELFALCRDVLERRTRPVAALVDCRMVGFYPTFASPMRDIVGALHDAEARPGVLSASIAHGFPWGDVEDVGTRVLVYADGDAEVAVREAEALAEHLYREREALLPNYPGVDESLDRAAALPGRVVLGDWSDNPGGGAPADSTFFLHALIARDARDAALGAIYDPVAAGLCADAGVGARLPIRLGGKMGPASGAPIDLLVEVMAVKEAHDQDAFGTREAMGLSAWVRSGGIDIVVVSRRAQVYGLDLFTGLGVDLLAKRLIVVKSSRHYEAAFGPISDLLWSVVSPGALRTDFGAFPYAKRDGVYFPRVADPWAVSGRPAPQIFSKSRP